jgi:hypothetical protein
MESIFVAIYLVCNIDLIIHALKVYLIEFLFLRLTQSQDKIDIFTYYLHIDKRI